MYFCLCRLWTLVPFVGSACHMHATPCEDGGQPVIASVGGRALACA